MNEKQKQLAEILDEAVQEVYDEERNLFEFSEEKKGGLEQAFAFRVGIYLNDTLQGTEYEVLDLDSEYNKHLGQKKNTVRFADGIRPDLIIHRRDSDEENKLVIEFKGWWIKNIDSDIQKLEDLTHPESVYHYSLGVFVHIGKETPNYRYFIDGHEFKEKE